MIAPQYHRHDLIWLAPEIDAGRFASAGDAEHARDWVRQKLPLVVARQPVESGKGSDQISLGFTLPSAPMRTRVMLRADRSAIMRHSRPLLLSDAIEHAPASWRARMRDLYRLCEQAGTIARVYGSLSSQAFARKPYLDEASDLDLLLECGADAGIRKLLNALENDRAGVPRIDGEVLTASGWAVAWRELAIALRAGEPRNVLARSDTEVRMVCCHELVH